MAKSSRTGSRKSSGTVTVIEARVHRSSRRNARIAYWLTALPSSALAMLIASQWTRPALSLLIGTVVGVVSGVVAYAAVRVWPYARIVWWWLGEILAGTLVLYAWSLLAGHTPMWVRATVMAAVVGVLLVPRVRRTVTAIGWCFVVRHRLRVCFSQFIGACPNNCVTVLFGITRIHRWGYAPGRTSPAS